MTKSIKRMKRLFAWGTALLLVGGLQAALLPVDEPITPVDYVSTLVGTQSKHALSTGNTYPAVAMPWGMNFWTPQTGTMGDGWAYTYDADKIRGFKQTHQPSPWINDYGQFAIMPITGKVAQQKRIDKEFDLNGTFYAFDSTTIDLCLSLYDWARFRSTKSGIKVHTQLDIRTEISTSFTITDAVVHDVNAMDSIAYEPFACYIFDRGYFDLRRLYHINEVSSFFVIREKRRPKYEITAGEDVLEGTDNVLQDQTIRFTGKRNCTNYPSEIRRIVYYSPEMNRTFTYYTNNFYLKASDIALLYRNRWKVELFFYEKYIIMQSYVVGIHSNKQIV